MTELGGAGGRGAVAPSLTMAALAVTVDCADPTRLSVFWKELLGYQSIGAVSQYASIGPTEGSVAGPKMIFQAVPEPKAGKNRLHLDIDLAPGVTLEPEVERALGLGAIVAVNGVIEEFDLRWQVLADPEGNEFCIVAKVSD